MFIVYWLSACNGPDAQAQFQRFGADALSEALQFAERMRKRQAAGDDVGFVTLCSENPQSVGPSGAADPPADYDWKKRRR
jgi:hypothetical protein